ncbi:MAG: BrnT family toxin [Acetobacteraceae bacterium]
MTGPLAYIGSSTFAWDPAKSDRCLRERGFDFAYVLPAFRDSARLVEPDDRFDYGEDRFRLIGQVAGVPYVVVFTRRGVTLRLISARRAGARERRAYHARAGRA